MSILISVLDWALQSGLSAAAKAAWHSIRPNDLDAHLREAVEEWASNLPADALVQPMAMFPETRQTDVGGDDRPSEVRNIGQKLLSREIPTEEDWFYALAEHWQRRKDELGKDGQPFFLLDFDKAEPHLKILAKRLVDVCTRDDELFRPAVVRLLAPAADRPVVINALRIVGVEVADDLPGRYHAEVEFKVLNPSPSTIFITSIEVDVDKVLLLEHAMPRFSMVPVSGVYNLLFDPELVPGSARVPLAQVVFANDADRFMVRVGINPDCHRVFREAVFIIRGRLNYNGDCHTAIEPLLLSVPWPRRILGQRGTPETAREAAIKNTTGLEEFLSETSAARSPRIRALVAEAKLLKEKFNLKGGAA